MVLTVGANIGDITIDKVYIGETKLTVTTHYTVDENSLTIKKTRLDDLSEGEHVIKILTDKGEILIPLTVYESEVTLDPDVLVYETGDVTLTVNYDGEGDLTIGDVLEGTNVLTKDTNYTVTKNKVKLLAAYLDGLDAETEYTFKIETNRGDGTAKITTPAAG